MAEEKELAVEQQTITEDKTATKKEKKKFKMPNREKRERTPKEATALMLGLISVFAAALAAVCAYMLPVVVAIILGAVAILFGFGSLMLGKGGTLPAILGIITGFFSIMAEILMIKLG